MSPPTHVSRRAIIVWAAAMCVYIVATTGRTSFGVAGVEALDHFHIDASLLAVFTAVQVGTYAALQIPMGLGIDRIGARRMLLGGALIMASGQILLGCTDSYAVAVLARVLIGAGDATAFLSVLRILPNWFPLRQAPIMMQLTSALGQLGQFLSAVPFLALLHLRGWTTAFIALGSAGIMVAIAAAVLVRDAPYVQTSPSPRIPVRAAIRSVIRHPACWQGFFTHYLGIFPQVVFTLLWGVPLMSLGLRLDAAHIGLVLVGNMIVIMVASPLAGVISARFSYNRRWVVLGGSCGIALAWLLFFSSPTPRSFAALMAVNILMALLSPIGNFGFDTVRENVDPRIMATGTGLANMGGFTGGMIATQCIGWLLDTVNSDSAGSYGWSDFRYAFLAPTAVWVAGIIGFIISNRKLRARKLT